MQGLIAVGRGRHAMVGLDLDCESLRTASEMVALAEAKRREIDSMYSEYSSMSEPNCCSVLQ